MNRNKEMGRVFSWLQMVCMWYFWQSTKSQSIIIRIRKCYPYLDYATVPA